MDETSSASRQRALSQYGGCWTDGKEGGQNLFLRRNRHPVQLQRNRLQRPACRTLPGDLRFERPHRRMGNGQRKYSRAHHGPSRPAGYAPRPGHLGRHGKKPASDGQSDGCKTCIQEVTLTTALTDTFRGGFLCPTRCVLRTDSCDQSPRNRVTPITAEPPLQASNDYSRNTAVPCVLTIRSSHKIRRQAYES